MNAIVRILLVEDSEDDALLLLRELRRSGYEPLHERVESADAMRMALARQAWDLILSDYMLPGFGGLEALAMVKVAGLDLPFILLSNKVSEETLVAAMRAGAADFLMKDRLERLGPVVRRELSDAAARRGLRQAEIEWRTAFDAVHDAIFIHDAEYRIVRANLAYGELGGLPVKSIIGKRYWEVFPLRDGPLPGCRNVTLHGSGMAEERVECTDGKSYISRSFSVDDAAGKYVFSVHVMQDITERERAQEALAQRENYYRKLIEGGSDVFFVINRAGTVIYRSESGKQLTGWETADVIGAQILDFVPAQFLPLARESIAHTLSNPGQMTRLELRMSRRDGTEVEVEILGKNLLDDPDVGGIVVTARDITERNASERAVRLFRTLIDHANDAVMVVDPLTLRYLDFNRRACLELGYSRDEFLTLTARDINPTMDRAAVERVDVQLRESKSAIFETVHRRKDGSSYPVEVSIQRIELDRPYNLVAARDITDRLRANKALHDAETRYRGIFTEARDGIVLIDAETGLVTDCNPEFERQCGRDLAQLRLLHIWDLRPPEVRDAARAKFHAVRTAGSGISAELPLQRPDGTILPVEFVSTRLRLGDRDFLQSTSRDIAERKRAETELRQLNWALRALGQSNSALVHAQSESDLFHSCCDAIAGTGGYPLAWIGLAREDTIHSIEIAAAAGAAIKFLADFSVSWADDARGRGPTGTAIRTGMAQVSNNLNASATYLPWIVAARAHGLSSSVSLPIRADDSVAGVLVVYSREPDAFGQTEVQLFEELAADIGYGIASRRTRVAYEASLIERERATRDLRASFESLIAVLAATVERRDPYTAGHQRRVAELAAAIGQALGLTPERIEGLHFAATIHDIGKIYIPAEILARPGKLPATEFEMIKAHAQVGYEIVKDVDFPWNVADIIHQHHERIDGTGYPQGLKGEQLLLESRILAVADVVEAMSSHRPYRPGLGLEAALAQIRGEAGISLDAHVVKACERVFSEQGFAFNNA